MNGNFKNALFGVAGGIAGTAVIGQVMTMLSKLESSEQQTREKRLVPEQPTEKLARQISEKTVGVKLSGKQKQTMGQIVHWGYGAFWGGVYGILRKHFPAISKAAGMPFGVSFTLFGPAMMLPLMGLTPPPTEYPISAHARELASHCAYAATVEGVCRICEKVDEQFSGNQQTKPELRAVS